MNIGLCEHGKGPGDGACEECAIQRSLDRMISELRFDADEMSKKAMECGDTSSREYLRGAANGMREAALRLETINDLSPNTKRDKLS